MSRARECGQARILLNHDSGSIGVEAAHPAVLVYDDQCEFCRRWVSRFTRWDRERAVELLPLREERAVRLTGKSRDQLEQAMHLVDADGSVYAGATAVRELFRFVPWGGVPRAMFRLPGALRLADRLYRLVAAIRQRLGCPGVQCALVARHGGDTPNSETRLEYRK